EKYQHIRHKEQRYETFNTDDAEIILVAYGMMARLAKKAVESLREKGHKVGLLRPISLWPFPQEIFRQLALSDKRLAFLVVEMSYGQMLEDVQLTLNGRVKVDFLGRSGGGVPSEEEIIKSSLSLLSL
ncbi:MAG: transketolase C-terminal domain-containing protein, partial [Candidatus Omnitrophota bacterium]